MLKKNTSKNFYKKFDLTLFPLILIIIFILRGVQSENYYIYMLLILWFFAAYLTDIKAFSSLIKNKVVLAFLIYLLYTLSISLIVENFMTSIGYSLGLLTMFFGIFVFNYYYKKYSLIHFEKLIFIFLSIWLYYCWKAIFFFTENENAARDIISHSDSQYESIAVGGGYGLGLGAAILGVFSISLIFQKNNKRRYKVFFSFIFITSFLLVFQTGSTVILVAMILGILLTVPKLIITTSFLQESNNKIQFLKMSITSFLFILIIYLWANLASVGKYINSIASNFNPLYESRLQLIGDKLMGKGSSGTLEVREFLYNKSYETFLDNFFFGTVYINGLSINPLIGGHSELLDTLAKVGLIGGLSYFLIFIINISIIRYKTRKFYSASFIFTFVILFLYNPFNFNQANFILFFLIPALSTVFVKKYEKRTKILKPLIK